MFLGMETMTIRRFIAGAAVATFVVVGQPAVLNPQDARAADLNIDKNGWKFGVVNTATDGLAIVNASFKGRRVFKRISVPQIRVVYSANPTMNDQLGDGGANIPYKPGSLRSGNDAKRIDVRARYEEPDWPNAMSYRYDMRYVFFSSGQFRARVYAYGPGLEPSQQYQVDFRIDLDIEGGSRDYFQHYYKGNWVAPRKECLCEDEGTHHNKAEWLVYDGATGRARYVRPRASDGRPWMWALRFRDGEGNQDLGPMYRSPGGFKNGERIQFRNVVVWYRSFAHYSRPEGCPNTCNKPVVIGPILQPSKL
jgi:hypothetical protein